MFLSRPLNISLGKLTSVVKFEFILDKFHNIPHDHVLHVKLYNEDAWTTDLIIIACGPKISPGLSILGQLFQSSPAESHSLDFCLQVVTLGVTWSATFPFTLWVPAEGLPCYAGCSLWRVWPIHPQHLWRIPTSNVGSPIHCNKFWLLMVSGQ